MVRSLPAENLLDLPGCLERHLPPDRVHRGTEVRGEQRPRVLQEPVRDAIRVAGQGPVLQGEHVRRVSGKPARAERVGHGLLVHN